MFSRTVTVAHLRYSVRTLFMCKTYFLFSIIIQNVQCAPVQRNLISCVRTITCVTAFEQYFIFCESNIFVISNFIFQQFLNVLSRSSVIFTLRYGNWFPTSISRWNYTFKNACYVASSDYYLDGGSSKAYAVSYGSSKNVTSLETLQLTSQLTYHPLQ